MPQSTPNLTTTNPQNKWQQLNQKFNGFVLSLGDVLSDITALEVNTMVVSQITGNKFVAELAYRSLYEIPFSPEDSQYDVGYFETQTPPIPQAFHIRYLNLRRRLTSTYQSVVNTGDVAATETIAADLPNPNTEEIRFLQLLENGQFLRTLRKLAELKAALDLNIKQLSGHREGTQADVVDIIYAQTVMQLDGDVINRFHENLLEAEYKDLLLQIHNQGVASGERQWRGLLQFMVDLVQDIIFRRGFSPDLNSVVNPQGNPMLDNPNNPNFP